MALKRKHIEALRRAIDEAATWRGTLTGNPDPQPLEEFDKFIATAREALKLVVKSAKTQHQKLAEMDSGYEMGLNTSSKTRRPKT